PRNELALATAQLPIDRGHGPSWGMPVVASTNGAGTSTGLVLVAPSMLSRSDLDPIAHLLAMTHWLLLGVITYEPPRRVRRRRARRPGRGVVDDVRRGGGGSTKLQSRRMGAVDEGRLAPGSRGPHRERLFIGAGPARASQWRHGRVRRPLAPTGESARNVWTALALPSPSAGGAAAVPLDVVGRDARAHPAARLDVQCRRDDG